LQTAKQRPALSSGSPDSWHARRLLHEIGSAGKVRLALDIGQASLFDPTTEQRL
jgi:hypothetical protein